MKAVKNKKAFKDFCLFANKQLYSWDIDPMYPVLKKYYQSKGFDLKSNDCIWKTFLYVSWYNIGTAITSWGLWVNHEQFLRNKSKDYSLINFKTGTERRLFRGRFKDYIEHICSFINLTNGKISKWANSSMSAGGEEGWKQIRHEFEKVKFNGAWASYKFADMMKHVHGFDITANDIGVGGNGKSAGPVVGMTILTERSWQECATNIKLQKALLEESIQNGVNFNGLDQLETSLCDYNSLYKGKFYAGHDIDKQMEDLRYADASFWEARAMVMPSEYLGENNGWFGVRPELKKVYKLKGLV